MALTNRSVVCMITGASRGIGREIAVQMARHIGPDSCMLLTARNEAKLADTAAAVKQLNPDVQVTTVVCELANIDAKLDEFEAELKAFAADDGLRRFDAAIIFHNAGSIGDNSRSAADMRNVAQISGHFTANVTSMIVLNSLFLDIVGRAELAKVTTVVNMTTVCAIEGFESMSQYSAAKAAREAFLRVLAAERPQCRVVNYSPGPIETELVSEVLNNTYSVDIRMLYEDLRLQNNMLTAEQSIGKLMEILDANDFTSGARLDYYELE